MRPKEGALGVGRQWRWFSACLERRQRAESLYVEAYLLRTSFLSTPKPDFQTHTTLFSLGVPCFSKATLRKNWSLSGGWDGCTRQSLPINESSMLPLPTPHTQCQPSSRVKGTGRPRVGRVPFSEGGV